MEVQGEREGKDQCPFPCSLSSLLSLNCRARAEGLARRLQTQIRQKEPSFTEGRMLVESNGKVRLAPSQGRAYSLDDHHIDAFKTHSEFRNIRPIHVVTSEPTLHLCLPPEPAAGEEACSPTEQEQDSDVYYDFDLVTPPEDYACSGGSRMTTRDIIQEENEKHEKPESGCVTSVTSPIMFSNSLALPPSTPSPLEECPPEELNSKASDVDLEAVRQLLVSSKVRSLYTVIDKEKPITVADNALADFVGVVKGHESSEKSPTSSDRSSSDEAEILPVHEEENQLVLSEENITCNSSYYLPPPSSYQIFSNQESCFDFEEMPSSVRKSKSSKRRMKRKKSYPSPSSVSESSDSRESSLEMPEREFPVTRLSDKHFEPKDPDRPKKECYKLDFHRSYSAECPKDEKQAKIFQTSASIDASCFQLPDVSENDEPSKSDPEENLIKSDQSSLNSKEEKLSFNTYNSSSENTSSSEEDAKLKALDHHSTPNLQSSNVSSHIKESEYYEDSSQKGKIIEENIDEFSPLNEEEILREIDDAITLLKRESDEVSKKLAKYEKHEEETVSLECIGGERLSEQVVGSYLGSAFGTQGGCQQFVPGSRGCELCKEEVPFLSFDNAFSDETSDLSVTKHECPIYDTNDFDSDFNSITSEIEMPRSKGRVKVKRAKTDPQTPLSLGATELPETTNATNFHGESSDALHLKASEKCASLTRTDSHEGGATNDNSTLTDTATCSSPLEETSLSNGNPPQSPLLDQNVNQSNVSNTEDSLQNYLCKKDCNSEAELGENHLNSAVNEITCEPKQLANEEDNQQSSAQQTTSYQEGSDDKSNGLSTTSEAVTPKDTDDSISGETFQNEKSCPNFPWSRRRRFRKKLPIDGENRKLENITIFGDDNDESSAANKTTTEDRVSAQSSISHLPNINDNNTSRVKDCPSDEALSSVSLSNLSPQKEVPIKPERRRGKGKDYKDNSPLQLPIKTSASEDPMPKLVDDVNESDMNDSPSTDAAIEAPSKSFGSHTDESGTECLKLECEDEEEIETLAEDDSAKTDETNPDEEEEDEAIITGRFKNLSKYTESVRRSSHEDDGLPPPPTEVILIDYNEPLENDPDEDTQEEETSIGTDLASELRRLSVDDPIVQGPSDESERSSEEREIEGEERSKRIKRSSSLRCGKTPPGTPGRKKIVRFADCLGLDLADIRTFLDGVPNVPPSAFCDLEVDEVGQSENAGPNSLPSYASYSAAASAAAALLQNQARRILTPMFQQPGSLPDFYDRLREQKVILENVSVGVDLSVKGVVRVVNESFHKKVYIRYTFDHWKNFHEATASYVDGSCDGFSDRFSFLLWGSFLQSNGSLVFCVKYCINDQQYWDSNRGSNYVLHCYSAPPPHVPLSNTEIQPLVGRPQNHCSMQHHPEGQHPSQQASHHGGTSSFLDTPTTPSDPWIARFF